MLFWNDLQWYRPAVNGDAYKALDKGQYGCSCNLSVCQAPNSAYWYNQGSMAFYCFDCANMLSRVNNFPAELARLPLDQTVLCIPPSHPNHPHYKQDGMFPGQDDFDHLCRLYPHRVTRLFNSFTDISAFQTRLINLLTIAHFDRVGVRIPIARNGDDPHDIAPMQVPHSLPYDVMPLVQKIQLTLMPPQWVLRLISENKPVRELPNDHSI